MADPEILKGPMSDWYHRGEHSGANPPTPSKSRRRRTLPKVEVSGELYDFLETNREQNERTLQEEVRFWLKKATGIK